MELHLPPAAPDPGADEETGAATAPLPVAAREASDGDLLAAYCRQGAAAEPAFAALVARHGAMVYRTCLRILWDAGLAEDAAQATFVVLARRAGQVRGAVGPFLHGVAVKIARRALGAENLRKQRELQAGELRRATAGNPAPAPHQELWLEIEPLLDESIEQLPARQREALVLYYLEGRTQADVAERMGLGRGTVAKQIQRALEKLRRRLALRGLRDTALEPAVAGEPATLGALLFSHLGGFAGRPGCPAFLSQAVPHLSAAHTAAGFAGLPPTTAAMAEGALHMLSWTQLKSALTLATLLFVTTVGAGVAYDRYAGPENRGGQADQGAQIAPGDLPAGPPADPPAPDQPGPAPAPTVTDELAAADKALAAKLEQKVTCYFDNVPVQEVFATLRQKGGFTLVYDRSALEMLAQTDGIELAVTEMKLRNALEHTAHLAVLEMRLERGVVFLRQAEHAVESPAALAARVREQSPATALTAADRKTLDFMKQPPTLDLSAANLDKHTWTQSLEGTLSALAQGDEDRIPVRREEGIADRRIPVDALENLTGSRWEIFAKLVSRCGLTWRLEDGAIVLVDRGRVTPSGCLRRIQEWPEDEEVKKLLLKRISVDFSQETPMPEALKRLHTTYGINIGYDSIDLQKQLAGQLAQLTAQELPARDVLEFLLRGVGCSYRIENGMAVIYEPRPPAVPNQQE